MFPQTLAIKARLNREQQTLHEITNEVITSREDLDTLGMELHFTYGAVEQAVTNHPNSVEGAALNLVCRWWDKEPETTQKKTDILVGAVKKMGKDRFATWIYEKLVGSMEDEVQGTAARASESQMEF